MGWNEVLATGFTIFTIILLVCAVMDHHWILVETKMQKYYSGIWKVCIKQVCSDIIAASPNVYGARTLLILALFCGIVGASFMTFTYRYSSPFTIYRYLVAAMGSLIAAALVFLALSIYTIRISTHSISRTGNITYLWSFYMAWTSCPCFILSGLFSLMAHQRLLVHGSGFSDGESSTLTLSSSEWTSSSTSYLDDSEGERKMSISARRSFHN